MKQSDLKSKSVLITGASRGIGRAVAESLAAAGARLTVTCRSSAEELQRFAASLEDRYEIPCVPLVFDVADPEACRTALSGLSSLDIVINNAGISRFGLLQELPETDLTDILATDLTGPFHILKYAVPLLLQSEAARIINISSVWGSRGAAMETAYSAAKGGLDALTRSLAKELAPSGIPVNAIACGVIDTDMNREHLSEEELEILKEEIPAGRFGTTQDVAETVLALLAAPSYLTGQIIALDGGWQV